MAKSTKPTPPRPKKKQHTKKEVAVKAEVPKTTKVEKANDVETHTVNEALKGLGYIFNIVASGTFTPVQLNKALGTAKLGITVTERSWTNAIQMAAKRTNGETTKGEPFKVEQLQKDNDGISVAYYERSREFDQKGKAKIGKYTMLTKAYFEYASETWLSQPKELAAVGFFKRVDRYKAHLFGGDLRYWVFNPLFSKMKCMPSIGGAKFVVADDPIFPKMVAFCKDIGISYRSYTQMADEETKKALAEDVRGSLGQTIDAIKQKIADILGKEKPRRDSVANAKKQLSQCRDELAMMQKLLGFKMDDITDTITDLEQQIDGVKLTPQQQTKKDEYKALLETLIGDDTYELTAGCYVIPGEIATQAGIKLPKKDGGALIQSVSGAIAELGYLGGFHNSNLVLKEVVVTEVTF